MCGECSSQGSVLNSLIVPATLRLAPLLSSLNLILVKLSSITSHLFSRMQHFILYSKSVRSSALHMTPIANVFPGRRAAHSVPPRSGEIAPSPCNAVERNIPLEILFKNVRESRAFDFPLALVPIRMVNESISRLAFS